MKMPKIRTEPTALELEAQERYEYGICRIGNHAKCLWFARHRPDHSLAPQGECAAANEKQVAVADAYLRRGQWPDGTGSYVLKHRAEEEVDGYVSNGALLLAAARLGLYLEWSFPDLNITSPNARVWKIGKVAAARRGRKCKSGA